MDNLVRNLIVICQWEDGGYNCTVDLWDDWSKTWETAVSYCARSGDPAPVNQWILEQLATGAYGPIDACPIATLPVVEPSDGPVVL